MAGILNHSDNTKTGYCTHIKAIIRTVFTSMFLFLEYFIRIPDLQDYCHSLVTVWMLIFNKME